MNTYDKIDSNSNVKFLHLWGEAKIDLIKSWEDNSSLFVLAKALETKVYENVFYIRFNEKLSFTREHLCLLELRDNLAVISIDLERFGLITKSDQFSLVPLILNRLSSIISIQEYSLSKFYDFKEGVLCEM